MKLYALNLHLDLGISMDLHIASLIRIKIEQFFSNKNLFKNFQRFLIGLHFLFLIILGSLRVHNLKRIPIVKFFISKKVDK